MIYALTGPNSFMLQERKRELIRAFVDEFGDMGLEQLDGEESSIERIREALESLPFLASKKLVVLHQPSLNKDFMELHKSLLDSLPESTDLIIVESKLDKRSSYFKYLKKLNGFEECKELEAPELTKWATLYVSKWQAKIDRTAARELVARTGANQQRLKNELDKLSMYSSSIDLKAVQALTVATPSSTIFELLDAAFAGNRKRAMQLYAEQRALNVEPMQIIAMLAWQLHVLAIVKAAGSKAPREIASQAKLNPYVVQKTATIARRLSLQQVKALVHELRELDEQLKQTKINADDALQAFLLDIGQ